MRSSSEKNDFRVVKDYYFARLEVLISVTSIPLNLRLFFGLIMHCFLVLIYTQAGKKIAVGE